MGLLTTGGDTFETEAEKNYFHERLCETVSLGPGINKKDIDVVVKRVLAKVK